MQNTTLAPSSSSLMLIGVGTSACRTVADMALKLPAHARVLLVDTDRAGAAGNFDFVLCGESRLAGRGTAGNSAAGKAAFQDAPEILDSHLQGVRVAVVFTCLGGGTGGSLAPEILKRLSQKGIVSLAFATTPFRMEGQERIRLSRAASALATQYADTSVIVALDDLVVAQEAPLAQALKEGMDKLSAGVTLLWRLVETPGYIRFDAERLRALLSDGGRARFGFGSATGPNRVADVLEGIKLSKGMAVSTRVREYFSGILAGDDLRLAEVGDIAGQLALRFGQEIPSSLATVNDESVFSGRLAVVLFVFEEATRAVKRSKANVEARPASGEALPVRFAAGATIYNGENLDIPTYIRQNLTLDL